MKKFLAMLLALCMVFALCACGQPADNNTNQNTNPSTEANGESTETTVVDDGKVTYTVTVTDLDNNPIAGAFVQLCLEACIPGATNGEGKAVFNVEEADYKVSFVSMPDGFTCDENEFHFDAGSYEMTIVLTPAV